MIIVLSFMMKRSKRLNAGLKPKRFRDSLPCRNGIACSFPCTLCELQCYNDTVQCSECDQWTHFKCLRLESALLNTWSEDSMHFLCSKCAFTDGKYDFRHALRRCVYQFNDIIIALSFPYLAIILLIITS